MTREIPSYLLNKLSEPYHRQAANQYRTSKELLEAIRLYLVDQYEQALREEEASPTIEKLFKALGRRQALQEFIKILPDTQRGNDDGQQSEQQ
jgi:hypothetical protein